jgi:hypothetical protein
MSELAFEATQEEEGCFCSEVKPIIPAGATEQYNLID